MKNINFDSLVLDKTKALQDNALLVISTVFMDRTLSNKCNNDIVCIKAIRVTQLKSQEQHFFMKLFKMFDQRVMTNTRRFYIFYFAVWE